MTWKLTWILTSNLTWNMTLDNKNQKICVKSQMLTYFCLKYSIIRFDEIGHECVTFMSFMSSMSISCQDCVFLRFLTWEWHESRNIFDMEIAFIIRTTLSPPFYDIRPLEAITTKIIVIKIKICIISKLSLLWHQAPGGNNNNKNSDIYDNMYHL